MRVRFCRFLSFLMVLLLCSCGQGSAGVSGSAPSASGVESSAPPAASTGGDSAPAGDEMLALWRSYAWLDLEPLPAEHGEDYVIQWEDEGMEAHIRFLLDRPEGDILHSDVWDIRVLDLQPGSAAPHDVLLEQPVPGCEHFTFESIYYVNEEVWQYYDGRTFPAVDSLRDLRHFDALQAFSMYPGQQGEPVTDISGPEECPHFQFFQLDDAAPQSLAPLASMNELESLSFYGCKTEGLDLTPLAGLPKLRVLRWEESAPLPSLEPLAQLPQLRFLSLGGTAFPSLEPLAGAALEYLALGCSFNARAVCDGMDYEPISRMPSLVALDLSGHQTLTLEDCAALLTAVPSLRYLDLSFSALSTSTQELAGIAPDVSLIA